MKIENFVKLCAESIKDTSFILIQQNEWLEILNSQINDLFPDIAIIKNSLIDLSEYKRSPIQIDMGDGSKYPNIIGIKRIYIVNADGEKRLFDNWNFDKDIKLLNLNVNPSSDYASFSDKILIVWIAEMEEKQKFSEEIELNNSQLQLLKKACSKEVISRILMDRIKLDRYKTLVGEANEYVLMAIQKNLSDEVEFSKRKRTNTLPVRSL